MKQDVSEPKSRRRPRGPFIELLDFDETYSDPTPAGGASSRGTRRGANGLRILAAPAPEPGLGWIRLTCLLYTSPSPRDRTRSRMPSSA